MVLYTVKRLKEIKTKKKIINRFSMRVRRGSCALVKSHTLSIKTLKISKPKKKKKQTKTEQIESFSGCAFAIIPPTENILLYAVYINHFVPDCPL